MIEAMIAQACRFERPLAKFLVEIHAEEGGEFGVFVLRSNQGARSQQTRERQHQAHDPVIHHFTPTTSKDRCHFICAPAICQLSESVHEECPRETLILDCSVSVRNSAEPDAPAKKTFLPRWRVGL